MTNEISKSDLVALIEEIAPFNNRYRDFVAKGEKATNILLVMWQVGAIIQAFVGRHEIAPHNLYWQIYGKAEGARNSYITRDFLSYCLRIKKYFRNSDDISKIYSHLQTHTLFIEAFPFLENSKFKLSKKKTDELVKILNSNYPPKDIFNFIKDIKAQHIGIKNPRTQKLGEVQPFFDNFVVIYNEVYGQIKSYGDKESGKLPNSVNKDYLTDLSQAISALMQENLLVPELKVKKNLPKDWHDFVNNLKYLHEADVEVRNRFKRLFPSKKIFEFSEMLHALTSEEGILNYKKRKGIGS